MEEKNSTTKTDNEKEMESKLLGEGFIKTNNLPITIADNISNVTDISLKDLAVKEGLSVRSTTICEDSYLTSLERILGYYEQNKSFKLLRRCGSKAEKELTELCEKYQNRKPIVDLDNIINKINILSPIQKAILNGHLKSLVSNLSIRTKGLHNISKSLNPEEIFQKIFIERYDFFYKNLDKKSIAELAKLKNDIRSFVEILQTFKNEQLNKEYAKLKIKIIFTNLSPNFETQIESAFDSNGKIKLFRLIELLLDSEQILNKIENRIFHLLYNEINTTNVTLESIEAKFQISRKRVHQIKNKLEDESQNYFSFITNFVSDDIVDYGINSTKSFQIIDKSVTKKINEVEEVNFNTTFYSIIFGLILNKSHSILGDDETICIFSSRNTIHSIFGNDETISIKELTEEQALDRIFSKTPLSRIERDWNSKYVKGGLSKKIIDNILKINGYIVSKPPQPQLYKRDVSNTDFSTNRHIIQWENQKLIQCPSPDKLNASKSPKRSHSILNNDATVLMQELTEDLVLEWEQADILKQEMEARQQKNILDIATTETNIDHTTEEA